MITRLTPRGPLQQQGILFGIDYDALQGRLRLFPRIPEALIGEDLRIEQVLLPLDTRTRLQMDIKRHDGGATVAFQIEGNQETPVEIFWPSSMLEEGIARDAQGELLPLLKTPQNLKAIGIAAPRSDNFVVHFE